MARNKLVENRFGNFSGTRRVITLSLSSRETFLVVKVRINIGSTLKPLLWVASHSRAIPLGKWLGKKTARKVGQPNG
jgi:hypothetical protein